MPIEKKEPCHETRHAEPSAWLLLPDGNTHFLTRTPCRIGRTPPQEIVLASPFVSGAHACIEAAEGGFHVLRDLNSKNGTFLEGRRVQENATLHNGAKIRIGPFDLLYQTAAQGMDSTTQIQDAFGGAAPAAAAGGRVRRLAMLGGAGIHDAALRTLLTTQPALRVVHSMSATGPLLRALQTEPVDLVLLNVSTAQLDAVAFIADLQSLPQPPRVFLLGAAEHAIVLERALSAGALGASFLSDSVDETLACINSALSGVKAFTRSVAGLVVISGSPQSPQGTIGPAGLSDRELAVFQLIGTGRQNRDIAAILGVSVKTVETHKEHIKEKLSLTNNARLSDVAKAWFESKHQRL